ncbi:toxin-antitoxin system HicB family antitoxin [Salininema proteolyticum]|uniref:Toxin-antitoxin system HicB family antitoxin n=1 Tax=Salininema proteolyticum TaxID=1607685 RepID=A0ABV8U049_9ACTN
MRQLLLRVDDELHARLAARAREEGRSINAIANEVLALIGNDHRTSRRERVRARALSLGILANRHALPDPQADPDDLREKAIRSMRGAGEIADSLIEEDRGRL